MDDYKKHKHSLQPQGAEPGASGRVKPAGSRLKSQKARDLTGAGLLCMYRQ